MKQRTASVEQRGVYRTNPANPAIKQHVGEETVRSAYCGEPEHRTTTDFLGVADGKWVFRCAGRPRAREFTQHTFTVEPPQ